MELKGHDPDCDRMWVLIHSLGDSEPSDEEIQEILAHFARCTACTDAEANVEEMLMVYKNQAAPPLPAGLEQRLLQYYCGNQEN